MSQSCWHRGVNDEEQFQVYRPKEGEPEGPLAWRQMRRGVADLYRRAEVSQKAGERYLDAFASVNDSTRLEQHTYWKGKRVRGLRLFGADSDLLAAVSRGEFSINGFGNRDLQRLLYTDAARSNPEARRRSGAVSRKLRLLRAHGLIKIVPHTYRYLLTAFGRQVITAIFAARQATIAQLSQAA